jgi:hypothetical protein
VKRPFRHILNALTAFSALLCVGTNALWVRSVTHSTRLCWRVDDMNYVDFFSQSGSLSVQHLETIHPYQTSRFRVSQRSLSSYFDQGGFRWWYFAADKSQFTYEVPHTIRRLIFPHWLMILITSLLPGTRLIRWGRRRRAEKLGLCPSCQLRLRATPDRCPECGTIPTR